MRQAIPSSPPPPTPDIEGAIDQNLGQTSKGPSAADRVPSECPEFLPFLLSLDPYTMWLLGNLIAVFIAIEARRPEEQEAIGNFLEIIATNIEYIAEQGAFLQELEDRRQSKIDAIEKEELKSEIDDLKKTVAKLQDLIISCCPSESSTAEETTSPSNTE